MLQLRWHICVIGSRRRNVCASGWRRYESIFGIGVNYDYTDKYRCPLAPQKYEKTTPYSEAIENVFTTGASKLGDKTASNVADKMFKSAAKQGKVGSKVTKAAAGALKSIKKYFGNAFNILLRIRDDMRQDKRGR